MMNLNPQDTIAAINRLLDFIIDVFASSSLASNAYDGDARSNEPVVDQLFDRIVTFFLGLFPQGAVFESGGGFINDFRKIADLVHPHDIALVMKTEKYATSHKILLLCL